MGNHMLYVIGASVIFFTSVITLNRTMLDNYYTITESSMLLTSASIGQGIIEEAQGKTYDESLINVSTPDIPICFTASDSLGTESGEHYPAFDDVDDYNGLVKLDTTKSGICSTVVTVCYVDSVNINQWTGSKGYYKKMEVTVYTNNDQNVKLNYLFSYNK